MFFDPQLGSLSAPQTLNRYVYCVNNPLRFTDPTGRFWGLHILAGAIAGLVVNVVVYLVVDVAIKGEEFSLGELGKQALIGAITGAVASATFGLSRVAALGSKVAATIGGKLGPYAGAAVCGAIAGAPAGAANYALSTPVNQWSTGGFLSSMALGAGAGAIGAAGGAYIKTLFPRSWNLGTGSPWDVVQTGVPTFASIGTAALSAMPTKILKTIFEGAANSATYASSSALRVVSSYMASSSHAEFPPAIVDAGLMPAFA